MSQLTKFLKEIEVESKITEIFSQKLDILDFIRNKFTFTEYQQCIASLTFTVEKIIKQKDEDTKIQLYKDLENPLNYTFEEKTFHITVSDIFDIPNNNISYKILKKINNYNEITPIINKVNLLEETNTPFYYIYQDPDNLYTNFKEIIIVSRSKYNKINTNIAEIIVNFDYLDKYLDLLYVGFKCLIFDDSICLDFYKFEDNIFIVFNININSTELFDTIKNPDLENFFSNKNYSDRSKMIKSYTKNDFKKLCIDGVNISKSFWNYTSEPIMINLALSYDEPLRYFRYNSKIYSLQINRCINKLFMNQ